MSHLSHLRAAIIWRRYERQSEGLPALAEMHVSPELWGHLIVEIKPLVVNQTGESHIEGQTEMELDGIKIRVIGHE